MHKYLIIWTFFVTIGLIFDAFAASSPTPQQMSLFSNDPHLEPSPTQIESQIHTRTNSPSDPSEQSCRSALAGINDNAEATIEINGSRLATYFPQNIWTFSPELKSLTEELIALLRSPLPAAFPFYDLRNRFQWATSTGSPVQQRSAQIKNIKLKIDQLVSNRSFDLINPDATFLAQRISRRLGSLVSQIGLKEDPTYYNVMVIPWLKRLYREYILGFFNPSFPNSEIEVESEFGLEVIHFAGLNSNGKPIWLYISFDPHKTSESIDLNDMANNIKVHHRTLLHRAHILRKNEFPDPYPRSEGERIQNRSQLVFVSYYALPQTLRSAYEQFYGEVVELNGASLNPYEFQSELGPPVNSRGR